MELKTKLTAMSFAAVLFGLFLAGVFLPDRDISTAERRKLAQSPDFSVQTSWTNSPSVTASAP